MPKQEQKPNNIDDLKPDMEAVDIDELEKLTKYECFRSGYAMAKPDFKELLRDRRRNLKLYFMKKHQRLSWNEILEEHYYVRFVLMELGDVLGSSHKGDVSDD